MNSRYIVPDEASTLGKMFLGASVIKGFADCMLSAVLILYLTSFGSGSADLSAVLIMAPIGIRARQTTCGII